MGARVKANIVARERFIVRIGTYHLCNRARCGTGAACKKGGWKAQVETSYVPINGIRWVCRIPHPGQWIQVAGRELSSTR